MAIPKKPFLCYLRHNLIKLVVIRENSGPFIQPTMHTLKQKTTYE